MTRGQVTLNSISDEFSLYLDGRSISNKELQKKLCQTQKSLVNNKLNGKELGYYLGTSSEGITHLSESCVQE